MSFFQKDVHSAHSQYADDKEMLIYVGDVVYCPNDVLIPHLVTSIDNPICVYQECNYLIHKYLEKYHQQTLP